MRARKAAGLAANLDRRRPPAIWESPIASFLWPNRVRNPVPVKCRIALCETLPQAIRRWPIRRTVADDVEYYDVLDDVDEGNARPRSLVLQVPQVCSNSFLLGGS